MTRLGRGDEFYLVRQLELFLELVRRLHLPRLGLGALLRSGLGTLLRSGLLHLLHNVLRGTFVRRREVIGFDKVLLHFLFFFEQPMPGTE